MKRYIAGIVTALVLMAGLAYSQGFTVKNYTEPCQGVNCDNRLVLGGSVVANGSEIVLTNVDLDTTDNSIGAGLCERQTGVTAAGVVSTDNLLWTMTSTDLNVAFTVLFIPNTGTVTIQVCNNSAGALDPGAVADFRVWRVQ